jgi:hypothetical protein
MLPPLTIAFPTSDSPGPSLNFTSAYLNSAFASPDTGPNNYPKSYLLNSVLHLYHTRRPVVRDPGRW